MSKGVERSESSKRKRDRELNADEHITSPKRQRQSDSIKSTPDKPETNLLSATPIKNESQPEGNELSLEEKRRRRKELKKARKRQLQAEKHQSRVKARSLQQEISGDTELRGTTAGTSTESDIVQGGNVAEAGAAESEAFDGEDRLTSKKTKKQRKRKNKTNGTTDGLELATTGIEAGVTSNAQDFFSATTLAPTSKVTTSSIDSSKILKKNLSASQNTRQPAKPWSFSPRRGGRYADQDLVFITDQQGSEYLVTAQGEALQILSVNDSLITRTLSAKDARRIISFHAVSTEQEDLVRVLYDDNTLLDWDWTTGNEEESKLISANVNMYRLAPLENRIASIYTTRTGTKCQILLDGILLHTLREQVIDLRVYHGANIIVALCQRLLVIGKRDAPGEDYTWIELGLQQDALCFDVRLFDASLTSRKRTQPAMNIAIGYEDGKIHIHSNIWSLFSTSSKPNLSSPRVLHWHRNAVATLKFSADGSYLVSGGKETVLVIWQLETGQKSFLPNLTAEIERIVINPAGNRYAIQLGDNSIMVLSTSELKPVAYFVGLQMAAHTQGSINGPQKLAAVLHPVRKNELLLTVPASQPRSDEDSTCRPFLQTFETSMASFSTRQALARNNVTDFNVSPAKVPIISPDVKLVAISPDGQWLATVDEWVPPSHDIEHIETTNDVGEGQDVERQEVYLKFWQWHAGTAKWMLNSRIDGPHSSNHEALAGTHVGSVFRLVSMPSRSGFVTIGQDCKVKLWTPKRRSRHGEALLDSTGAAQEEWTCQMTAELEVFDQRADMEMDGERKPLDATLAVSEDESLIAAALTSTTYSASYYNETVHFIDTRNGKIRAGNHSITAPGLLELAFADRFLIALSPRVLRVWDVVEDMLQSSISIPVGDGALDDQIPLFAINKLDNAAVIASPGYLSVIQLQPPVVKSRLNMQQSVAAILSMPRERGFMIVYDDATTSTLSSVLSSTSSQAVVLGSGASLGAEATDAVSPILRPQESRNALLETKLAVRGSGDAQLPMLEDDRRVVRPEEMASIFDEGADGMALPSIKEMFHAVAGLFGRKPRTLAVHA